ncbi:hypothetical protein ACSBQT_03450 [Brevibacterium sp. H602]|uniref:hypothetical protein n=1 Tax=Brevibacterium sp. H602 TaxID=3444316 RepID=UPI003EBC5BE8
MSGYVLAVGDESRIRRVSQLFVPEETDILALGSGMSLLYVSNSGYVSNGAIFQGYGIDHIRAAMVFAGAPSSELPEPSHPIEGSYFTARFSAAEVRVGADSYGFVPMCWFNDGGVSAVSDSYLTLIMMRQELGFSRTPNSETILGRMWLNSMSLQQMGRETFCEEIRYATPATELVIDGRNGDLEEYPMDLSEFYRGSFADHADAVNESAVRMVRTFKTYAASESLTTLGLSGGTDSRVCLAAALAADMQDNLHIASTNKKTRLNDNQDYAVAVALSEKFGFSLNQPSSNVQGSLTSNDLLAGWAATGMGLYDALYMPAKFRHRPIPVFAVGGQGAEISKGNFGWRPLEAINMPPEALAQAARALEAMGISREHKWGSEWHYIGFRNAIHGGRSTLSSDYVARPAAQIPLIGLSRSGENELPAPGKTSPSVVLDLLIKLNPGMATAPFDDVRKNVSEHYVEKRLDELGGPIEADHLSPYVQYGTPQPAKGTCISQTELARSAGYEGNLDPSTLLPLAYAGVKDFRDVVPESIIEKIDGLNSGSRTRIGAATREAGALGKLIALGTVA